MSIKRVVSHKLYIVIITFILVSFFIFAGTKFFSRDAERQREKARSYTEQAVSFYEKNQMDDFLAIVGEALFYNELSENVEQEIYLYSLLSQYYLEIGADKSGYDTILAGRRLKNFYTIQDPFIRSQALHAYGRFLLSESDFESALKAETQMEEDSHFFEASDATYARYCYYRALGFKSYILMMQGKTEDSYALANTIYTEFYDASAEQTHIGVYDFLLPILWVRTQWAIRNQNYAKAIAYYHEYGKVASKFDYIMKKTTLAKELMFALPVSMTNEREQLFNELARDTDVLSQVFLDQYTGLTDEKLSRTIETLRFTNERENAKKRFSSRLFLNLTVFFILILIMLIVYSETQIDGLTKLRNRRALNARLGRLASAGKKYSAIMIDIDNFKKLNDGFGHDFGDEVLRGVAQVLLSNEGRNAKCYRYGGEEMVIILEHFDLERAVRFSEHVRTEISGLKWRKDVHVTASFGLGFEMPDSVKEADENMYVAKQKGKNFTAYKKDGKQYLAERRLDIRNPIPDRV